MAAVGELPANVRLLAELLAQQRRVNAAVGKKRVELILEDGHLREFYVHEQVPIPELAEEAVILPE